MVLTAADLYEIDKIACNCTNNDECGIEVLKGKCEDET
jgi:hypothetical protein